MHITLRLKCLLILAVACLSMTATAQEYAVVVNPKNESTLTKNEVANVFLGKMKKFPKGDEAVPVMQVSSTDITNAFVKTVLGKSWIQFRSYWSRLLFSGKGYPPKRLKNDAEVKAFISKNPKAIGIISKKAVDDTVKVVLRF